MSNEFEKSKIQQIAGYNQREMLRKTKRLLEYVGIDNIESNQYDDNAQFIHDKLKTMELADIADRADKTYFDTQRYADFRLANRNNTNTGW